MQQRFDSSERARRGIVGRPERRRRCRPTDSGRRNGIDGFIVENPIAADTATPTGSSVPYGPSDANLWVADRPWCWWRSRSRSAGRARQTASKGRRNEKLAGRRRGTREPLQNVPDSVLCCTGRGHCSNRRDGTLCLSVFLSV